MGGIDAVIAGVRVVDSVPALRLPAPIAVGLGGRTRLTPLASALAR